MISRSQEEIERLVAEWATLSALGELPILLRNRTLTSKQLAQSTKQGRQDASAWCSQKGSGLAQWTLIGPSAKMGLFVND